jgi:phage terminase large subunit-like protein
MRKRGRVQVAFEWERPPTRRAIARLEALAYERHARDLETGHKRDLWFDAAAADRAVYFIESFCRHSQGELAGQLFELTDWEEFQVRVLFGWKRADGSRRFRFAYIQVARKNGKTTLAAAIALYLTIADQEPGAEVYSAATKRDQSKKCFDEAARMVRQSPELREVCEVFGGRPHSRVNNISVDELAAKFEPLASDADTLDGLNVHGAILDEIHKWKRAELLDVIQYGTGARRQPLLFGITTPGTGTEGVCREQRDYSEKVLTGIVEDDAYFAFVCEPDPEADFTDQKTWEQGNPNIDYTVNREDLDEECARALEIVSRQNDFRRYRCGQWTEQAERWLDMHVWRQRNGGTFDPEILRGRPCYGGLDLASTTDLAAFGLWFPPREIDIREDRPWHYLLTFPFIPADRLARLKRTDRVPFEAWRDEGYLEATPGDAIDYEYIRQTILEAAGLYQILEIGYDPWNALNLVQQLQDTDGLTMVLIQQGTRSLNAPCKELERMLSRGLVRHGEHPVLTWCASNAATWTDANGCIKPSKKSSGGKIDALQAQIMALARAMLHDTAGSIWESGEAIV